MKPFVPFPFLTLLIAEVPYCVDLPMLFQVGYVVAWLFAIANAFRPRVRFLGAWRVRAVVLTIGLSMLLGSRFLGGPLDEHVVPHEPFALVALGSLISLAGLGFARLLALVTLECRIVALRRGR
jgi:hypothetical protein